MTRRGYNKIASCENAVSQVPNELGAPDINALYGRLHGPTFDPSVASFGNKKHQLDFIKNKTVTTIFFQLNLTATKLF